MPFANRKIHFRGTFQFTIAEFEIYHPPGNLKLNYFVIFQSLKLRILMEKILSISLKLNFTPNTLGCYGLSSVSYWSHCPALTKGRTQVGNVTSQLFYVVDNLFF